MLTTVTLHTHTTIEMEDEFMMRSKISMSVSAALLLGLVSITGCGTNTAEKTNVQTKNVRG